MIPRKIDFGHVAASALPHAETLVPRWLPDGRREASEWVALNPRRSDRKRGSFKVNLRSGRWGDFATGDRGGDLISLAAFVFHLSQIEAARKIAAAIGIDPHAA